MYFFGTVYCWFNAFFCQNLESYLWGFDGMDYTGRIWFNTFGVVAIAISAVIVLLYYYVINNPRWNRWWHWLVFLGLNGLINMFYAAAKTLSALNTPLIPESLLYERDINGEVVSTLIHSSDCWGFGFANFIVSTIFFVVISFLIKWGSSNCKHSPVL